MKRAKAQKKPEKNKKYPVCISVYLTKAQFREIVSAACGVEMSVSEYVRKMTMKGIYD